MLAREDLNEYINTQTLALILTGVLIGGGITLAADMQSGNADRQAIAQDLVDTLETSSGQQLEVVKTSETNGLYKIQLSNSDNQLSTYYITKDGEMLLQESSVTNFRNFTRTVEAQSQFTGCMAEENVAFYGNASQRATAAQIQLLGGPNQVSDIYRDINNEQNLRQALQNGVRRVPGFYHNNSTLQGVQSISKLEEFTGCDYPLN